MDKEAQRMLMPFEVMEDVEKGMRNSPTTESSSSSAHSVVVRGTRIRLRILGIIAVTVIPVFAVMIVMLMSVIILYSVVKVPDIYMIGNMTGTVNASLGTLGHAVLTPDLQVKMRLAL